MNNLNEIIETIKKSNKIGVACHTFPDGDALGSISALIQGLRKINKDCYILSKDDKVMEQLEFMNLSKEFNESNAIIKENTDLVVVLDCGNFERVSFDQKTLSKVKLVNVDHHRTNDNYGDLNYIDYKASATGEIVFEMLGLMNIELDKDIAENLYIAISTDTGSFKYESTTKKTHEIAGTLIDLGIDFQDISKKLFETKSKERLILLSKALSSMESFFNGKVNIMTIMENDFVAADVKDRDTGDIINFGLSPKDSEVSIVLKEADEKIRASLRTKKKVDAGEFAQNFKGGGHKRAAGLTLDTPNFEEAKDILLRELEVYLY